MCLAFLRFQPDEEWPLLLASIRDEDLARPAARPGEWWPDTDPGVLGGRDQRAGGTWLAVDPDRRAVAAIFTPPVLAAPAVGQRTRGELPLLALRHGITQKLDLHPYEPFTLLLADRTEAVWWSWAGSRLERTPVAPGMHIANIDGLDATSQSARQARWREPFEASAPVPFNPDGAPADRWAGWLNLLGQGLEPERPDSLLIRRTVGEGTYGTKSVALLAIGKDDLRYDESDRPWERDSWTTIR